MSTIVSQGNNESKTLLFGKYGTQDNHTVTLLLPKERRKSDLAVG